MARRQRSQCGLEGVSVMATRGFGLAGETAADTIVTTAIEVERSGYDSFWLSQPKHGSTLSLLQSVSLETANLQLGIGAIPFTSLAPQEISRQVIELSLPLDRLRLGVGSGTGAGSIERLRRGVETLRQLVGVEIVVAPLGPKMCMLAGEIADTVLLNWLTPAFATTSTSWINEGASRAGRTPPSTAAYVRCALGSSSSAALEAECERYGAFPHYAAHFVRQGVRPIDTTIHARDTNELQERLRGYEAVLDHVVVRAITPQFTSSEILSVLLSSTPQI